MELTLNLLILGRVLITVSYENVNYLITCLNNFPSCTIDINVLNPFHVGFCQTSNLKCSTSQQLTCLPDIQPHAVHLLNSTTL